MADRSSASESRSLGIRLLAATAAVVLIGGCSTALSPSPTATSTQPGGEPAIPEVPSVEVAMAISPFADHMHYAIGVEKGFFRDVGITVTPKPYGKNILIPDMTPAVESGTVDVGTMCLSCWVPSLDQLSDRFKLFHFSDVFHGHAFLAGKLNTNLKSLAEFQQEGMDFDSALKATVAQFKGLSLGQAVGDPQSLSLQEIVFRRGGITVDDLGSREGLEQVKLLQQAIAERYDVVLPTGGPTVVELMKRGFKPLIRAVDVAANPEPGREAESLLLAGPDGNYATTEWVEANHDTVLRFSAAVWKTLDFMNESPDEAIAIQMPILNQLAGTELGTDEGKILYSTIQSFIPWDQQYETYYDPNSPFNFKKFFDAFVADAKAKGSLQPDKEYATAPYIAADSIFAEAMKLKEDSEGLLTAAQKVIDSAKASGKDMTKAEEMVEKATFYANLRDYLDAQRFAEAAKAWAEYLAAR